MTINECPRLPGFVYIYTLSDPRTSEVRYVGQSVQPQVRYKYHLNIRSGCNTAVKTAWVQELALVDLQPVFEAVEVTEEHNADTQERLWIKHFLSTGADLLNVEHVSWYRRSRRPVNRTKSQKVRIAIDLPPDLIEWGRRQIGGLSLLTNCILWCAKNGKIPLPNPSEYEKLTAAPTSRR